MIYVIKVDSCIVNVLLSVFRKTLLTNVETSSNFLQHKINVPVMGLTNQKNKFIYHTHKQLIETVLLSVTLVACDT